MASIQKTDWGKWKVRYRTEEGATRSKTFAKRSDAEDFAASVRVQKRRGEFVDPAAGRVLFSDVAADWREGQMHRESTREQVGSILRRQIIPAFGDRPIASIRPSHVQKWVQTQAATSAPSTVETRYRFLAAIFRSAVRDRIIAQSPCQGIALPKKGRPQVEPLPVEVVERLIGAADTELRPIIVTAAGTGLRLGECLGLTLDRLDFLRRTVTIDRQLVTVGGETKFGPPKTDASYRRVPLPDVVVTALARHLELYPAGTDGLVFTRAGEPWPRNRFSERWNAARATAGCPGAKFHELRHFYASLLIAHGESVKAVQNRLGHASAAETLDTYSHLWPDSEDSTRAAVEAVLGAGRVSSRVQSASS